MVSASQSMTPRLTEIICAFSGPPRPDLTASSVAELSGNSRGTSLDGARSITSGVSVGQLYRVMEPGPFVVNHTTIVDVIRWRSSAHPDRKAFTFVQGAQNALQVMTYAELDKRARKIAGWLQKEHLRDERVLIVQSGEFEFITAFLGCLYAGSL